jgi:hypothetical protein
MNHHFKAAFFKAAIVLIPSYTAAFLTDKMVNVVPTLAAAGFFSSTFQVSDKESPERVDEDAGEPDVSDLTDNVSDSAEA